MKAIVILLALLGATSACKPGVKADKPEEKLQDKPAAAIIGTGTLAGTLGPVMGEHGYRIIYGSRDPARESVQSLVKRTGANASAVGQREASVLAQIILLAVPGEVVEAVADTLGALDGQ